MVDEKIDVGGTSDGSDWRLEASASADQQPDKYFNRRKEDLELVGKAHQEIVAMLQSLSSDPEEAAAGLKALTDLRSSRQSSTPEQQQKFTGELARGFVDLHSKRDTLQLGYISPFPRFAMGNGSKEGYHKILGAEIPEWSEEQKAEFLKLIKEQGLFDSTQWRNEAATLEPARTELTQLGQDALKRRAETPSQTKPLGPEAPPAAPKPPTPPIVPGK